MSYAQYLEYCAITGTIPQPVPQHNADITSDYDKTSVQIGSSDLPSILGQLATSSNDGLTSDQALQRISQSGPNKLESPPSKSLWRLILEQFDDKLVQILLGVAVISGIFSYVEFRAHTLLTGEKQHFSQFFHGANHHLGHSHSQCRSGGLAESAGRGKP